MARGGRGDGAALHAARAGVRVEEATLAQLTGERDAAAAGSPATSTAAATVAEAQRLTVHALSRSDPAAGARSSAGAGFVPARADRHRRAAAGAAGDARRRGCARSRPHSTFRTRSPISSARSERRCHDRSASTSRRRHHSAAPPLAACSARGTGRSRERDGRAGHGRTGGARHDPPSSTRPARHARARRRARGRRARAGAHRRDAEGRRRSRPPRRPAGALRDSDRSPPKSAASAPKSARAEARSRTRRRRRRARTSCSSAASPRARRSRTPIARSPTRRRRWPKRARRTARLKRSPPARSCARPSTASSRSARTTRAISSKPPPPIRCCASSIRAVSKSGVGAARRRLAHHAWRTAHLAPVGGAASEALKVLPAPAAVEPGAATVPVRLAFVAPTNLPAGTPVQVDIEAEELHRDVLWFRRRRSCAKARRPRCSSPTDDKAQRRAVEVGVADGDARRDQVRRQGRRAGDRRRPGRPARRRARSRCRARTRQMSVAALAIRQRCALRSLVCRSALVDCRRGRRVLAAEQHLSRRSVPAHRRSSRTAARCRRSRCR